MIWSELRERYPQQWLVVEALEAHTSTQKERVLDNLAVIETCKDGNLAMKRYRDLHRKHPGREFYFFHTSREELNIQEREWLGIRINNEASAQI